MGRFIDDRYEAEFVVDKSQEEVWQALQVENEVEPVWLSAFPRMPGFDTTGTVIEVDPPRLARATKESEPCKDTEIAITLESVDNGTKVIVVQSGFPAYVKDALESFTIGGNQIINDLALYLQRGVSMSRHSLPWAFAGFTTREVDTGLEVAAVMPGFFGEKVGLEEGDLLMTLGEAPVFTQLDLQAMLRVFKAGDELAATWVRGSELQQGQAQL